MRIVSPFLKKVVYPSLSMTGVLRRTSRAGLAVVTYHGVLPRGYKTVDPAFDGNLVSADILQQHLRLLKSRYNVISPEDVLAWRQGRLELPPAAVLLTCDDGLLNNLTDMLPVLQQEEVRCLFFVTGASAGETRTMLWYEELFLLFSQAPAGVFEISCDGVVIMGDLGGPGQRHGIWWNSVKRLSAFDSVTRGSLLRIAGRHFGLNARRCLDAEDSPLRRRFGLLTASEVRQLSSAGMTIGAHTLSHPMLSQLPLEPARVEIVESRNRLETLLQKRVWGFAYPFGDAQSVTPQVLAIPQQAGYEAAFLNAGGGLGTNLPPYALPRVHVTAKMNLAEFEAHVSGFHANLQRRAGRSGTTVTTEGG